MTIAITRCRAELGVTAPDVTIEVFLSGGLPEAMRQLLESDR